MPHSAKSILDKMEIRTILRTISEQLGTCHYLAGEGGKATILGGEGHNFFSSCLGEGHNFFKIF